MGQKVYQLSREELQSLVTPGVDPWSEADMLLEMIKGKEIKFRICDDKFEFMHVRAIILESEKDMPGADKLLVEDWAGRVQPKPWAIKIIETL